MQIKGGSKKKKKKEGGVGETEGGFEFARIYSYLHGEIDVCEIYFYRIYFSFPETSTCRPWVADRIVSVIDIHSPMHHDHL